MKGNESAVGGSLAGCCFLPAGREAMIERRGYCYVGAAL